MLVVIDQAVVDLIRDDKDVVFSGNIGNCLKPFAAAHRAGGVIWITQQDGFRVRRDGFFDHRRIGLKVILHIGIHFYGLAAS